MGCKINIFDKTERILKMDRSLRYYWFIAILAGIIILFNQLIYIEQLYRHEKTTYVTQQNEWITNAIYDFNMKMADPKQTVSFNPKNNRLIYVINNQILRFQLKKEDNLSLVGNQTYYDIQDTSRWTLQHFHSYLQAKRDTHVIKNFAIHFAIEDSIHQIKDSYPPHRNSSQECELKIPLGFLAKDTLYASYNYPLTLFLDLASGHISLVFFISLLLIFCVISLFHTLHWEKRAGKYREIFVHNIVHDLKRPIETELKLHYILYKTLPPEQKILLEKSTTELNNVLQSISRILLQSTDAHGLHLKIKDFNLYEMLDKLSCPDSWNIVKEKQADIQLQYLSDRHVITGDPNFLQPVFLNLIDNALKYAGEKVHIRITCKDINPNAIRIEVKDNGTGITPEALKHIFKRYHRGDHQNDMKINGHGQGLYFARMVVRAHGGSITAESVVGTGTTFTVILPIK